MEKIKQELLELGFNVDSIGTVYWIEAISFVKDNPLTWDMNEIYENIAVMYTTSKQNVERGMRYSIRTAKNNIRQKYGYYNEIRNKTFLSLIRFELL